MMLHGIGFIQEDRQANARGASQFGSLNWAMLMASRDIAEGRFQLRTMLGLEPATLSDSGYPLLLQTGEMFNGQPLHDRQHPHDFLMELVAMYERPFTRTTVFELYAAPAGEPALGPVAFMHRPSAMDNPAAPVKLQFTGGYGYLRSPEAIQPNLPLHRTVASALYGRKLGDGQWAATLIWGANAQPGFDLSKSLLLESEAILDQRSTVFGRVEWVRKSTEGLVVDVPPADFPPTQLFGGEISLGCIFEIVRGTGATPGLGGSGTINPVPLHSSRPTEPGHRWVFGYSFRSDRSAAAGCGCRLRRQWLYRDNAPLYLSSPPTPFRVQPLTVVGWHRRHGASAKSFNWTFRKKRLGSGRSRRLGINPSDTAITPRDKLALLDKLGTKSHPRPCPSLPRRASLRPADCRRHPPPRVAQNASF